MTGGGGFYRLDSGSNLIRRFEFPGEEIKKVMSNEGVYDFHFDRNNRLWFGLRSNRIWYYDSKTNIVSSIPVPEDLNLKYGDICFRIKEDPSGNLWMLYVTEGLFMVNPGTRAIRHIEIPWKDGQEGYNDMLIDLSGKIRIIHINGISIYDPVTGKIEDISIKLPDNNCFSFQLDNGDFLLHNNEKLILIDDTIHPNSKPPEVYFTSLRVNNVEYSQLYPGDEEIRSIESVMLKTDQNNLKIEFTGLSFLEAENNQYSYFMKGVDQDTVKTTSGMRFAEYKRLKPGQYQFWVNASNNDGIWNPVGKTLNISITPPGYRSSLAYILYGLGLVLLLYSLIELRLKRLRREKKRQE
jgi:ligand-binding sensor domain-containing protein